MALTETRSIKQMLNQPTGKFSAYFASRARIKQQLTSIFIKNLRKYRKEFYCVPYVDNQGLTGKKKNLIFYVSVPSESFNMNKIRWDCVILVEYDSTKNIGDRNAYFYCNSPSFIYTYAYVMYNRGLIPSFVLPRVPSACLSIPPKNRNPIETLGFDKILFQALEYLVTGGCLTDQYISRFQKPWNGQTMKELLTRVANVDKLVALYQHAKRLDALKRHTNRKVITPNQKKNMINDQRKYDMFKKRVNPHSLGIIFKHAPRSKITARRAIRAIQARGPKPKVTNTF